MAWILQQTRHLGWGYTGKISKQSALIISMAITLIAMVVEFVYSYITGSLMLFSDAIHMLSHLAALSISLAGICIAAKPASDKYPFGFKKAESLAALFNGVGLAIFSAYIVYESVLRIVDPQVIVVGETVAVALIGLLVNLLTAFILFKSEGEDLNMKSAIMHMLADTFSSAAIIVGAIFIYFTSWYFIDALLSMVIAGVVGKWSYGLLIKSSRNLMDVSPDQLSASEVKTYLYNKFDTILAVDTVKIWKLNESENAGMLKLKVYPAETYEYRFLKREVAKKLRKKFRVHELNIELDW
ncbi:MAG: cation diffusion facilitator family transporter [Luteibaculum sp.]